MKEVSKAMRIGAMILGILGGIVGVSGAVSGISRL